MKRTFRVLQFTVRIEATRWQIVKSSSKFFQAAQRLFPHLLFSKEREIFCDEKLLGELVEGKGRKERKVSVSVGTDERFEVFWKLCDIAVRNASKLARAEWMNPNTIHGKYFLECDGEKELRVALQDIPWMNFL